VKNDIYDALQLEGHLTLCRAFTCFITSP